jgi:lysozyme family protein
MSDYASAIDFVIHLEDSTLSGRVEHDADGATRYGLLDRWHPDLVEAGYYTTDPVTALQMAKTYYKPNYWDKFRGDQLTSNRVAAQILSIGVNDGIVQGIKFAQQAAGVTADGVFGVISLAAVNALDEATFLQRFDQTAKAHYDAVVAANPAKSVDLKGWYNRVDLISKYQG